ncbi:MAG: hypothetical protein GH151_08685 [Bacteroidetes bacterium]|nr:hypothetical protein [Bacteroidota bacterium]
MKNTKEKLNHKSKIVKSSFQQVDVASSLSITQACLRKSGKLGSAFVHCNISGSNITKYSRLNTVAKYMNRQNIIKLDKAINENTIFIMLKTWGKAVHVSCKCYCCQKNAQWLHESRLEIITLDADSTVKSVCGNQEGAEKGFNTTKKYIPKQRQTEFC